MAPIDQADLQSLIGELAQKHGVPGAAAGVLHEGTTSVASAGVTSQATGIEVTPDTLFQFGSVTKVYTATLVMQLVADGRLQLDGPIRAYLPELMLKDPDATRRITLRQVLSHSAGLADNFDPDHERGDDCIRQAVARYAELPQIAAPGRMFSYSNPGYIIAGRLVEHVTGETWDAALKSRLLAPLGARRTVTFAEEAIVHRVAVGHLDPELTGTPTPTSVWQWPRYIGPAGGAIGTVEDLLVFARMHLNAGRTSNGQTALPGELVELMQQPQIDNPDKGMSSAWGTGWVVYDWGGTRVIGHDGGGVGQVALLRVAPAHGFAVGVLTNAYGGETLGDDLFRQLFGQYVGVEPPRAPQPTGTVNVNPSRYVGTYQGWSGVRTHVHLHEGKLAADLEWGGMNEGIFTPIENAPLRAIDENTFLVHMPDLNQDWRFVFFDDDAEGRAGALHCLGRANPRVG
jgi:CubicO group peptidase (beta-lactamase class C family)